MPMGWGEGPVVVRGRESRSHKASSVFVAEVLITEVAGENPDALWPDLPGGRVAGTCDAYQG